MMREDREAVNRGGWQPVFRQRGRGQGANSGIHTVFVDDLPEALNPKGLFSLFSKFGVVKDVFIPTKRRKATRSRFGFVRFDCPVAAGVAIQKTNGVWCDSKILKVKKANFGKEQVLKETYNPAKRRCTYAEVVKGDALTKGKELKVQAEEYGIGWLLSSLVVKLKNLVSFRDFKEDLQNRGFQNIEVKEGWGRPAFVTFPSVQGMRSRSTTINKWVKDWCVKAVE
ncbi:hypothetical protein ACSBR2_030605 [Camellia fascicularis]